MPVGTEEKAKRVDIRVRRILARDGTELAQLTVFCPSQLASRLLDACKKCDACEEIVIDPAERDSFVRCTAAAESQQYPTPSGPELSIGRVDAGISPDGLRTPVLQVMTRNVICVRSDLNLSELTMILFEHGISGAPVVDPQGKPLGIVSKTDLLRENYEDLELAEDRLARRKGVDAEGRTSSALRVQDIMTCNVSWLPERATVAEAAALMALEGIRRIPILDDQDQVVGIICASDILSWLARQAGYVVPSRFPTRR
jgi:CBS domain-containing protein